MNPPSNLARMPMRVRHDQLERLGDNSDFRSVCPTCKQGTLLVRRDQVSFEILDIDYCTLCAQQYVYMDAVIAGEVVKHVTKSPSEIRDVRDALTKMDDALGD